MKHDIRSCNVELRVEGEGTSRKLAGYAAIFNSFSEDLGGFREIIRPGTFSRALANNADVRALVDHDSTLILGRTKSGTLRLREDERGLRYEIDLPNTRVGNDIAESVKRGDVSGSSFAFRAVKDSWRTENGSDVRELHDVDLFDVGPVTYPAYVATEASLRALNAHRSSGDRLRNLRIELALRS
jgi:uncharacterized protein